MNVWVGTAGYAYQAWVGGFYPPGVEHLGYYARHFPAVEINSSFHRPPTAVQVARMADRVPMAFRFTLKVPKSASHEQDARELPAFLLAAHQLDARGQLLGLLVQFPEAFRNGPAAREWLTRVRERLRPHPLAVEFRHVSWDVPGLSRWLHDRDLTCVSVGVPDLPSLFPPGLRAFGECIYARLHTADAGNWYQEGAKRYDYDFPGEAISWWSDALAHAAAGGVREACVFFNNCVGVQAVTNAQRLMVQLRGRAGVNVVGPPEPLRERTLFDGLDGEPGA